MLTKRQIIEGELNLISLRPDQCRAHTQFVAEFHCKNFSKFCCNRPRAVGCSHLRHIHQHRMFQPRAKCGVCVLHIRHKGGKKLGSFLNQPRTAYDERLIPRLQHCLCMRRCYRLARCLGENRIALPQHTFIFHHLFHVRRAGLGNHQVQKTAPVHRRAECDGTVLR